MIEKLSVENFTVFPRAEFTFGERLNVVIGENGSGKTLLFKLLYAVLTTLPECPLDKAFFMQTLPPPLLQRVAGIFRVARPAELVNAAFCAANTKIVSAGDHIVHVDLTKIVSRVFLELQAAGKRDTYHFRLMYNDVTIGDWPAEGASLRTDAADRLPIPPAVFLPAKELLTMYPGFQSLYREYSLPYDLTYYDTVCKLGLPYKRDDPPEFRDVIAKVAAVLGDRIFLREEKFYFHPAEAPEGTDFDVNLAAEGWRKLAMLLQLLKNGGLRKGMCLFWDEPDANLNPTLVKVAAAAIVALGDAGVQVFLATHSLFLVNEIEILTAGRPADGGIRYFNLRRGAEAEQGNAFSELRHALLLDAALAQSDRYLAEEV